MKGYVNWDDIRDDMVERAGGEEAVKERVKRLRAKTQGFRLAEARRSRGLTQQQIADRMGVTKGRVSQIEKGDISGTDVLARYAFALGGALGLSITFWDGEVAELG